MTDHIVVVGAGVFGAWTAHHLQRLGCRVTLIDAWGPAHSRASSGGESRLIRAAYGKDAIYSRMASESLLQWKQLSASAGLSTFIPCGTLFFFPSEEPYLRASIDVHRDCGFRSELFGQAELARRFPMIDFDGISIGLYEPGFGALMARRSVQTLVERFVAAGGTYLKGLVELPVHGPTLDEIGLSSGEQVRADRFVFAAGPWLPKLFPDVVGKRIRATRQEIFYFAPPAGDRRFQPEAMPGWADFNDGDMFYGLPDLEARGVKFAHDQHGPAIDPDQLDRRPTSRALAEIINYRDRRFPLLRDAPMTGAEVCQYENTSNGDFLIDLHPVWANVLLVGGGSGHGFKHGPEVGRYAAARLLGSIKPELRFSLATKNESHRREIY